MDAGPTDGTRRNRTPTETRHADSMIDHATATDRRGTDDRPTLAETDHTNPYTGEVFGATQMYSRGRTVAADGGEANGESRVSSELWSDGGEASDASRVSSGLRSDGSEANSGSRASSKLRSDGGEASDASRASSEAKASDGGERGADPRTNGTDTGTGTTAHDGDEEEEETDNVATMADVAHEPPGDADGAQAAYDRGARDE
ncbi:hypothetical protein BRC99_03635 [Halobacteriales archaeon QS_7_69_60]|nr:MAG: hypothetical protein BRC99_03635 [Halobacteriales archaeon QS_7_69_60]